MIDLEKKLILAEEIKGYCYNKKVKEAKMDYIGRATLNSKTHYLFYCYACNGQHKLDDIRNLKIKYQNKWEMITK